MKIFYISSADHTENSLPHSICRWTWCTVTMIFTITDIFLLRCFRNCPLVTRLQSRRCCRLLTVNIWSRTKRAYCWSKVRNVFSFHVATDSILLFISNTEPNSDIEFLLYDSPPFHTHSAKHCRFVSLIPDQSWKMECLLSKSAQCLTLLSFLRGMSWGTLKLCMQTLGAYS